MKVFVKTLKGTQFEIEVKLQDTVADLKKNIETVQGPDVYPAAQQILIYQGKVLKDDTTTMEENEVSENSFIVIMLSKNKSSSAPPPTTPVAAPPPQPPSFTINAPSDNLQDTVHRILDMGGGACYRDTVVRALDAASNNQERAVQYLNLGIVPDPPELPPFDGAPPVLAAQPPPTGPNANLLNIFPQHQPLAATGADGFLNFLFHIPQIQTFRWMLQSHPQLLQPVLQLLGRQHPQLAALIREHRDEVVRRILQPFEQGVSVVIEPFRFTFEDVKAMRRIQAIMGFNWSLVRDVYVACDRNEEIAANYLLDHIHEFEE